MWTTFKLIDWLKISSMSRSFNYCIIPFCVQGQNSKSNSPLCLIVHISVFYLSASFVVTQYLGQEICGKSEFVGWMFPIHTHAIQPLQTDFILIEGIWKGLNQGQVELWYCLVKMGWTESSCQKGTFLKYNKCHFDRKKEEKKICFLKWCS